LNPDHKASDQAMGSDLKHLRLLQLADSALPIGSLAHSFGLETLVFMELLAVEDLPDFLRGYLEEAGLLEAVACREGFHLSGEASENFDPLRWLAINELLSAFKLAREGREASATLGCNFLRTVLRLGEYPVLQNAWGVSRARNGLIHHSAAFGLVCGALGFAEGPAILAFLHQWTACLVSACQRLLPLGQNAATHILWDLKPAIVQAAEQSSGKSLDSANCAMPLPDWASMEHPALPTRLFIS
jgi:urease accessory protein